MGNRHPEGYPAIVIKHRRQHHHVGDVTVPCLIGIIADEAVARPHCIGRIGGKEALDGLRIEHRMVLDPPTDHNDLTAGIGQPRGPVLAFPQDWRIAGMKQRMRHCFGGFPDPAEHNFGRNRIKAHPASPVSMIRLPHGSTWQDIPARITVVESNCWTTAGPSSLSPALSFARS